MLNSLYSVPPDGVGDVPIFRDTEELVRPGDGVEVGVKTIVEVCV